MKNPAKYLTISACIFLLSACGNGDPQENTSAEPGTAVPTWNALTPFPSYGAGPLWASYNSVDEIIEESNVFIGSFAAAPKKKLSLEEVYGEQNGDVKANTNENSTSGAITVELWDFHVKETLQGDSRQGETISVLVSDYESDTLGVKIDPRRVGTQEIVLLTASQPLASYSDGFTYELAHGYYLGANFFLLDGKTVMMDPNAKIPFYSLQRATPDASIAEQLGIDN